MAWEEVTEQGDEHRTLIDPPFCIRVKTVCTYNLTTPCDDLCSGKEPTPTATREEIQLWNGAQFVGTFNDREQVAKVVSNLRQRMLNQGGKKWR